MTKEELIQNMEGGKIVYCENEQQAIEFLEYMESLGYPLYETPDDIRKNMQQFIEERCFSPGFDCDGEVVCYYNDFIEKTFHSGKSGDAIHFDEISHLLDWCEVVCEEEFYEAFQTLLGTKR